MALGLAMGSATALPAATGGFYHYQDIGDIRGLVDRTQNDLRVASGLEHGNKQRDRYLNAQDSLSKFDRKMSKGKFDKGALEHSIHDLKEILEHNTLQPSTRDALHRDMTDLKVARDRR